ncbi:hypothetical protein FLL45_09600 [Aliikangiella marina]|uniref:HD-GYP domain-containing protein n=1 Tax=Aliikangiella marina TaxID=1712262 RepID=A0A545TD87_9GAMM|nr:HD domain-containing phosphohydrolase [Aliikangiella marina]TQV75183.1 hypothetical protein FLL45_09600 [Aliikangiella marina]
MKEKESRDYYTDNLAQVSKSNSVIASENIYNEKGALIVPAGASISADVAEKIASHKLSKPIEETVSLERSVSSQVIIAHFKKMPDHPEIQAIFTSEKLLAHFEEACKGIDRYPLINQKLTVMAERFPAIYKKAVFGAFLSMLLCRELDFTEQQRHAIFIGALARDIGMLHIDPKIVSKSGRFNAQEWRLIQGHVAISFHFLNLVPNVSQNTKVAVLEHHERTDGFGYPRRKLEFELSREGQVIAFSDMLIALFNKYVIELGYSMLALEPILQINASRHKYENAQAAIRIFKSLVAPMKPKHQGKKIGELVSRLSRAHPLFNLLFLQMQEFNELLTKANFGIDLKPTTHSLSALQSIMITSGISDESILRWIDSLKIDSMLDQDILEIEKYGLMINEGFWRFNELMKRFEVMLASNQIPAEKQEEYSRYFAQVKKTYSLLASLLTVKS